MAICSRDGCTKTLRSDNSTGACSSSCQSPDAPASVRARVTNPGREVAAPKREPGAAVDRALVMAKFRTVTEALGFDPDELLAEAAQAWLDGAGAAVKAANEAVE